MNNYIIWNSTDFYSYSIWIHLKIWWWTCYVHMNGFIMSGYNMNCIDTMTMQKCASRRDKFHATIHNLFRLDAAKTCAHCMWHDWYKTFRSHWPSEWSDIVHGKTYGFNSNHHATIALHLGPKVSHVRLRLCVWSCHEHPCWMRSNTALVIKNHFSTSHVTCVTYPQPFRFKGY